MSEQLSATIEVGLDGSKVQEGVAPIAKTLENLGKTARKSGKDAAEGLSSVGEEAGKTTEKVDRATKNLISSIERATARTKAELEGASKSGARLYEILANQRGVNLDALNPYLAKLREVEKAQEDARKSVGNLGVSSAQTAAALRGVPAQFTDIITSLQGGQQPLTVFLQQGGQLKDMFGGAGNAAKALGGYVLGLVNPFTIAAGAAVALGAAYYQGSKEAQEYQKALILTGNAAGTTAGQMQDIARSIAETGKTTQSAAAEAVVALASTGNIGVSSLQKFADVAVQMQKTVGKSVADTAKDLSELGKSPYEASIKLNEQYRYLTPAILANIKALVDQGRASEAAALAQNTYADTMAGRTRDIKENLGTIEQSWNSLKGVAQKAWDVMLNVGRKDTESEQIERLKRNIKEREQALASTYANSTVVKVEQQKLLEADKARLKVLQDQEESQRKQANEQKKIADNTAASNEWLKQGEQFLTKQQQLTLEIRKIQEQGKAAGISEKEIQDRIALAKASDKYKESLSKEENAYKSLMQSIDQKLALSGLELNSEKALTEGQKLRVKLMDVVEQSHGKITKAQILEQAKKIDLIRANELLRASYIALDKDLGKLKIQTAADIVSDMQRQEQAYVSLIESQSQYSQSLQDNAELLQLEMSHLGQSTTAKNVAIEQLKIQIALKKELQKIEENSLLSDARKKELSDSARVNASVAASQAEIKVQQQEWTKFYNDIYNGLTDSLYRGFEAGKGFFQSFWDGIKNLFKTTVLKLAVQGVMTGVLGAGFAGTAAAATGDASQVGSAASTYSMGKSLWDGFAAAGSVGGGIAAGLGGTITGFGNLVGSQSIAAFGSGLGMSTAAAGEAAAIYGAAGNTAVAGGLTSGASIGSALAAIPGWGWAALGAAAVAAKFGGGKDRVTGDQNVSGMLGTNDISRNVAWTKDGGWFNSDTAGTWKYNLANSTAIASNGKAYQDTANVGNDSALLKTLNDTYASLKAASADYAKALGLDASTIAGRADAINFALGKTKEDNDKAIAAAFGTVADSIAASLSPSLSSFAKAGESTGQTLARLATGFTDINKIIGTLGIKEFSQSLEGANSAQKLIELSGGLEKFTSGAAFFAENFLTEAEKIKPAADLVAETMARLGMSNIKTVEDFKLAIVGGKDANDQLVKGLDLTTEAGAKMYAELIAIAPQFKAVADFAENSTEALQKRAAEERKFAEAQKLANDTAQQRLGLQDEYNKLTMSSTELLKLQRDALFESNRGLFDSIQAVKAKQEAEAQAAQAAAEAIRKAQETAAAVANERNGLQNEYNRLTMSASEMLKAQRDALDESNRALFDSIEAIKLKQDAESKAAAEAVRVAGERANLQEEYNRLTMSAGQLLQMQRDSLAESNKGLFDSIQAEKARQAALEESNQAVKAAAAAEEKAQNEAKSAFNSWLSDVKSAFSRESGIFNDTIKQFTSLADSLKEYGNSLTNGSAALLSPEAQYKANREQFLEVSSRARAGDKDALAKLQQVSEAFRESSLNYNASNKGYFDDLELIKKSTADSILSSMAQVDVAKLQLNYLEQQVKGLFDINESVKTVASLLGGSAAGGMATDASGMSAWEKLSLEANVRQNLEHVGGFDALYSKTQAGDVDAMRTLQQQMVRWAGFGLKEDQYNSLIGQDSLKKMLDLFNLRKEDFSANLLTRWDGKEQKLNFDRNGLFEGTTSYAKIAEDLKAMQDLARVQSSGANGIYSGNRPDPLPPPPQNTNQAETEEQIRLLKRQNELIAALVNQTASDGKDNVISLSEINKRLKAIESAGSLLGAQA